MTQRQQAAELRRLTLRMQAALYARRLVWRTFPPMVAVLMDTRLRLVGAWIVDEMRRVEGAQRGDAA